MGNPQSKSAEHTTASGVPRGKSLTKKLAYMSSYIPIVISLNVVVSDNLDWTNDGENNLSTPFMTVGLSIYHDLILFIYRIDLAYLYE